MTLAGAVTAAAGLLLAPQRTWANLLLACLFLLGLGLAGIFFVALQYATGAGWSVAFRRVPEAMSAVLPYGAAGLLLVLLLRPSLYSWTESLPGDPAFWFKRLWLNYPFFLLRSAVYLGLWILFSRRIVGLSRRQDRDNDVRFTRSNIRLSVLFIVVFAFTCWLASFDWIMSLEPEWYSTIFGVYNFAGLFSSGLAMILVLAITLERAGPLRGYLTADHLHDLGKLLFAFSTFWMYIWFSQYMLIWYANIPEETNYFVRRLNGFWEPVFILNFLLNWAAPFAVLLHVPAKRSPGMLLKIAWTVLVGRWVDLYLMILPTFAGKLPVFGIWEVGIIAGAAGLFFLVVLRALGQAEIVPGNDPFLEESLHYHN
ncbi:MAG: hypothetical protein HY235_20010 [Acidobacteria bacterium]|nr:hypothetical protein [Acidobacteriota bacterium]